MPVARTDSTSQLFGLPPCLRVPIAARTVEAIEAFVGRIVNRREGRDGRVNALLVSPHDFPVTKGSNVPLWQHKGATEFELRLHPPRQVWVHVDYSRYRDAYIRFGSPPIPEGYFLDHIQNREAIRLRGYSHPYIRLCPVSRRVNTSGGASRGGEGMEKEFLRNLGSYSAEVQAAAKRAMSCDIVYADPMDLSSSTRSDRVAL